MDDSPEPRQRPEVAVFDLDGTLTWRDTLVPFLLGFLRRHPSRLWRLWRLPMACAGYCIGRNGRGGLKSSMIRMVMGGDSRARINAYAREFVDAMQARGMFRKTALAVVESHRLAGDHLILLSASPDLYVPLIGRQLGFEQVICTELTWRADTLIGTLQTANRRGEEKVVCLAGIRRQYAGVPVAAYGNSSADLPHLRQADRAVLVNGNAAARRQAAAVGIFTDSWT